VAQFVRLAFDTRAGEMRRLKSFATAKAVKNAVTFIGGMTMAEKLASTRNSTRNLHLELHKFTANLRRSPAINKAIAADFDRFAQVSY
jgi:hypothetical protein